MKIKEYIPLIPIIAIYLFFAVSGINWGLPSKFRADISYPLELRNEQFSNLMKETRDKIYEFSNQSPAGRIYDKKDNEMSIIPIMRSIGSINGILVFEGQQNVLANFIRPYLLRTHHPDEQMTLAAIARMKPKKLDFNPKLNQYGGVYIYSLGAWLYISHIAGLINIVPDITYYFTNPEAMARIFAAGRGYNIFVMILILIVQFKLFKRLFNPRIAFMSCLLTSLIPGIIFQSHILKPYFISSLFAFLCLYFSFELLENPEKISGYIFSGASAGLTAGSMPSFGLIMIAPFTVFVLNKADNIKKYVVLILSAGFSFIATNPYWIIDYKNLMLELGSFKNDKAPFIFSVFRDTFYNNISVGISIWISIFIAAGVILLIGNNKKNIVLILTAVFPVLITSWLFKYPEPSIETLRLFMPWAMMSTVFAAVFIDYLAEKTNLKLFAYLIFTVLIINSAAQSYICSYNFKIDSTPYSSRIQAGKWISENIPKGSRIGLPAMPEPAIVPPFDFNNYKINVSLKNPVDNSCDYLVFITKIPDSVSIDKTWELVKEFKTIENLYLFKYQMGTSLVNSPIYIFKRTK